MANQHKSAIAAFCQSQALQIGTEEHQQPIELNPNERNYLIILANQLKKYLIILAYQLIANQHKSANAAFCLRQALQILTEGYQQPIEQNPNEKIPNYFTKLANQLINLISLPLEVGTSNLESRTLIAHKINPHEKIPN